MFMHRNRGRYAQAVSLGILTALSIGTATQAADAQDSFVFVAYSNHTGGTNLMSGDYPGAAQALRQHPGGSLADPGALATNRCVAYAMTRQLPQAQAACDTAVREAQYPDAAPFAQTRRQAHDSAAVAYSNRAVLHWLSADAAAAQEDLARARALAPLAEFVVRNLSAMNSRQNP